MDSSPLLLLIGISVGMFGTLVGAGGGFILMPVLFFLYPNQSPEQLTAVSLAVVFFNAFSGSVAYARAGRVDYRSGVVFALASFPGAALGSIVTSYLSRTIFDPIFAVFMMIAGGYLFLRPGRAQKKNEDNKSIYPTRVFTERSGEIHHLSFSMPIGISISILVGFISSLLGIGGGIIHVPALVHLLGFPVHIATATSHFILAWMTFVATVVHLIQGDLAWGITRVAYLAPGAVIGAQIGAALSSRVHGNAIIRVLSLALIFVGIRLILKF